MAAGTFEAHFWLPVDDQRRFYGRVDHSLEDGVRLHLVNSKRVGFMEQNPSRLPVLHGRSIDGKRLTGLDVCVTGYTAYGYGPEAGDEVNALAMQLLRGGEHHVHAADEVRAAGALVEIHGLKEFLTGGSYGHAALWPPSDGIEKPSSLEVPIDKGVTLTFSVYKRVSNSKMTKSEEVAVSAWLAFEDPATLPTIHEYIDGLTDLVLFSTRYPSYVTALTTYPGEPLVDGVEVLEQARPRPGQGSSSIALALNLANHDDPGELVTAWYRLRRQIGPVWGLLFSTLGREQLLLEDQLLGLLAFAEGYHRALHDEPRLTPEQVKAAQNAIKAALEDEVVRKVYVEATAHADGQTQRERLRVLTDRALDPLGDWWAVDRDVFAARLIHTRDWLIHWGTRRKHAVTEAAGLYELVRGLLLVLHVNLLLDLGLTETAAAAATAEGGWRFEGPPHPVGDTAST